MAKNKNTQPEAGTNAAEQMPAVKEATKKGWFVIAKTDPYIDGVKRFAAKLKPEIVQTADGGMVLAKEDKNAAAILENYRFRAAGGCDKARTAAAEAALKELKA
jgi:hypothetical protein